MKLSYHDQLNEVSSETKTKQDNNVTNCIGVVYVKNDTALSWPIE